MWKGRAHKYLMTGASHLPCGRSRYSIRIHSGKVVRYSILAADTFDGFHSCVEGWVERAFSSGLRGPYSCCPLEYSYQSWAPCHELRVSMPLACGMADWAVDGKVNP